MLLFYTSVFMNGVNSEKSVTGKQDQRSKTSAMA
ncbi:hypothetical protein MmiHf6_16650 [Methanimicrococcus hongohii]|uniref:Uncharacterized protein n=1 Tax=Methanimicrococcus hongohii TaxID=3028295 RepID=A0AA96ZTA3_9EURY|nr:hypothetical protein MmiHf6_16650 [Methanimicrococcus sp. Hf6]